MGTAIRKCPGVRAAKSLGFPDNAISGHEFKLPSICAVTVNKFSKVSRLSPMMRRR